MTVKQELDKLGKSIVSDAIKTVPVDTGALKASLKYETNFISNDEFQIVINEKYYGQYVDKGTRYQKAQSYMSNAIEKNLPKGIEDIVNTITGEILHSIKEQE
jgi:HK97 gp10 family phage protein